MRFSEIRDLQDIRHQRNDAKDKERDVEGVDKRPPQPTEHRVVLSPRKAVCAVLFPHCFHLLGG